MTLLNVVHIDDEDNTSSTVADHCNEVGRALSCEVRYTHVHTLPELNEYIRREVPDLLIVDLRLGPSVTNREGWSAVDEALSRAVIPVMVYSGYATETVQGARRNALVVPVTKGAETLGPQLRALLTLKQRLNEERRFVNEQLDSITLETAGKLLEGVPPPSVNEQTLVMLVRSRLISVMLNTPPAPGGSFPPEAIFVHPPIELLGQSPNQVVTGDFIRIPSGATNDGLWWVVSPTCDLISRGASGPKVVHLLAVRCHLTPWSFKPFPKDLRDRLGTARDPGPADPNLQNDLHEFLKSRYSDGSLAMLKCPAAIFGSGLLMIDFKDYRTIEWSGGDAANPTRLATLSSPFADSLRALFFSDLARIGTPDSATARERKAWVEGFSKEVLVRP